MAQGARLTEKTLFAIYAVLALPDGSRGDLH